MRFALPLLVLLLAGCASTPPVALPAAPLQFTAFQSQGSNPAVMDASAETITVLAVDGLNFLPSAGGLTELDPSATELLDHAHAAGLKAELMVGNFSSDLEDFDEQLAYDTLSNLPARAAVVSDLADLVDEQGWDGISIDLESLAPRDAELLTAFAAELRAALGAGRSISIALMVGGEGVDLAALVPVIDRFILMAYDEHGPWEDVPGPIGSLDWQRAGLEALLESVPAAKVELGVAGYGYGWGPSGDGQLSVAAARALAPDADFDEDAGEWTATLADGTEMWWSDIQSFRMRVALAREYGLAGVALWSLEQGDPITAKDLR
jgi:spore germination protein YaaH